jgi:uncharacterized protein (TIGR02058 family)
MFASAAWGWHIETAVHLIRMILGGAFDRYPKLQVVIGHLGEGIPFMLPRLNKNLPKEVTKLDRPLGAYLRENVHYTFGGFNFAGTFLNLLLEVGVERIMFSVDHPYGSMAEARAFLQHLPVSEADRERIAHGNAEKLFGLYANGGAPSAPSWYLASASPPDCRTMTKKRMVLEIGMGTDIRGGDPTKAACRALRDALWHNSLSIATALGHPLDAMIVDVHIGVPRPEMVDKTQVLAVLPYGKGTVTVTEGGLEIPNDAGTDRTLIANACVVVSLDIS